ncbi:MAG: B12-binding domain-containing radical SAM protein [Desulfobacterales bacterium]|nr:B12-binding domain-containing radical SAM protein [Desulfobacterales bacterium]
MILKHLQTGFITNKGFILINKDILLVQPPIEDFYLTKKRTLPYGLCSIAGSLKSHGFNVEIFDALATNKAKIIAWSEEFEYLRPFYGRSDNSAFSLFHDYKHFGYSFEHIGKIARDKQPFLIGISSLFTAYFDSVIETAKAIKKFLPNCKIVIGGHHPTQLPKAAMECTQIDYVIRGEGERSMPLLADALKDNTSLDEVFGIVFRRDDGSLHFSDPFWLKDLTDLPLPALELVKQKFYQRNNKGAAIVVSSRGCPMKCSYCAVSASSSYAPFRQRKVDDVIKELESQVETFDIGFIDFEDENLCLKKSWFLSLMGEIQEKFPDKNFELRAMNGLFPSSIDEDIIQAMKSAGFKTLNLSLGSTSKEQLEKFCRKDVRKSYENALDLAKKYHLQSVSYIIAAAPGQISDQSVDDLLYLAAKPTLVGLSIFYPAPGSMDYQNCQGKGLLPKSFSLMRSTALPIVDTCSRVQSVTLLRLSRILNFMKALKNERLSFPDPEKCCQNYIDLNMDRKVAGILLLSWFLHDGVIRGVDRAGRIYGHVCDPMLTKRFIDGIKTLEIKGTS